jgi:hypothetical protein
MMSPAQSVIAGMITPALLILASASLVATALVRLGRVVDRSRLLIAAIEAGNIRDPAALRVALGDHQQRAIYAERSVALFFLAVLIFVVDCLTIGLDHFSGDRLTWMPVTFTIGGMALLCAGAAFMVIESRLGAHQIIAEITQARDRLAQGC